MRYVFRDEWKNPGESQSPSPDAQADAALAAPAGAPADAPVDVPDPLQIMALARGARPVNLSRAKDHAGQLGIPEAVALAAPEACAEEVAARRMRANPGPSLWAGDDAGKAALVADNAAPLADVHEAFAMFGARGSSPQAAGQGMPEEVFRRRNGDLVGPVYAGEYLDGGSRMDNTLPETSFFSPPDIQPTEDALAFLMHEAGSPAGPAENAFSLADVEGQSPEDAAALAADSLYSRDIGSRRYANGGASALENTKRALWNGLSELNQSFVGTAWAFAENIFGKGSAISEFIRGGVEYYGGLKGPEPQPDQALSGFLYDALRIAPQMAANLTSAALSPGLALVNMGSQIMGSSYVQLRDEGASPARAFLSSAANSALQAPLEYIGTKGILSAWERSGSQSILKAASAGAIREGWTEALQKAPEYVTHAWARAGLHGEGFGEQFDWFLGEIADANNLRQATAEAIYEGLLGALWGFGLGGAQASFQSLRRGDSERDSLLRQLSIEARDAGRRLALDQALIRAREALAKAPAASDPEALARMAEESLPAEARQVWINAADLGQLMQKWGGNPRELVDLLGGDIEAINNALGSGSPLAIPLARLLASPNADLSAALTDVARLEPEGKSGLEARLWTPQERLEDVVRHVLFQSEGEVAPDEMDAGEYTNELLADAADARQTALRLHREGTRLRREMVAAGYTEATARTYVDLLSANALAMRDAYGLDPIASMLERYHVERAEAPAGQAKAPAEEMPDFAEQADRSFREEEARRDLEAAAAAKISAMSPGEYDNHLRDQLAASEAAPADSSRAGGSESAGSPEPAGQPASQGPASLNEGDGGRTRGAVDISGQDITIRLFKDKDLSTIPHEAAHIFMEHLLAVGRNTGSLALGRLRSALSRIEDSDTVRQEWQGIFSKVLAARTEADALAALDEARAELISRRNRARQAQAREKELEARAMEQEDLNSPIYADEMDTPQLRATLDGRESTQHYRNAERLGADIKGWNRALSATRECIRHLRGLDQARRDIATLRQWAEVPDKSDLRPGTAAWRDLQEKVARGMEQYFMEGNAPSRKLAGVFARLRAWLLKIYRNARQLLGREISPEVATVFDRMLATDRELREMAGLGRALEAERGFAERMGKALNPEELEMLARLREEARSRMAERMDKTYLAGRRERFAQYRAEFAASLKNHRLWGNIGQIVLNRGASYEQCAREIGEEGAAALKAARPDLFAEKEGLDMDEMLGFLTVKEDKPYTAAEFWKRAYNDIVVEGLDEEILASQLAEARLAAEDSAQWASGQEMAADAFGRYLEALDRIALRMASEKAVSDAEARRLWANGNRTPRVWIQQQADEKLRSMTMREIRPDRFQAALRQALREREQAMQAGDVMAALEAVNRARVANEMIQKCLSFQKLGADLENLAAACRRLKPGTIQHSHHEALRQLLRRFHLGEMRGDMDLTLHGRGQRWLYEHCFPESDVDATKPVFPDWLLEGISPITGECPGCGYILWRDLRPDHIQSIMDLMQHLRFVGRDLAASNLKSRQASENLVSHGCRDLMEGMPEARVWDLESAKGKLGKFMREVYQSVHQLIWFARKADGLNNLMGESEMGLMEREIVKIRNAENRVRGRMDNLARMLDPHLRQISRTTEKLKDKYGRRMNLTGQDGRPVQLPESLQKAYGASEWTPDMLIALALNMGNQSNMRRLLSGYPDLGYDTVAELLGGRMAQRLFADRMRPFEDRRQGLLSVADWQAIQGIWDATGSLWADTQAAYEAEFDYKIQGIQRKGILLHDGREPIYLEGGYYPVRYDPKVSEKVAGWSEQEDLLSSSESLFQVPAAARGHTKARTNEPPGLPVKLDTSILLDHLRDAVRFIELGGLVRRLDRITREPSFKQKYISVYGLEDYNSVRPNLRGLVREEAPSRFDTIAQLADKLRKYIVIWGLGYRLKVAVLQTTAVFPGMGDIGARPVLSAMADLVRHPGMIRELWQASPYLKSRLRNIDMDIQTRMQGLKNRNREFVIAGKRMSYEDIVNLALFPITAVDTCACSAIWIAAYRKKLAELGRLDKAGPDSPPPQPKPDAAQKAGQAIASEETATLFEDGPDPELAAQIERDPFNFEGNDPRPTGRELFPQEAARDNAQAAAPADNMVYRFIQMQNRHHVAAVEYADGIVKQGNPDYDPSSRSGFLRQRGFYRLFNQFASAITLYSARHKFMYTAHSKGKASLPRLIRFEIYENLLPALFMTTFLALARGHAGDDDKEALAQLLLRTSLDQAFMKVPIFGSLITDGIMSGLGLNGGSMRRPGLRNMLETPIDLGGGLLMAMGAAGRKGRKEDYEKLTWALFDMLCFYARIPVSRVARDAQRGYEQWQSGHGTPLSILMPRPGKTKKQKFYK